MRRTLFVAAIALIATGCRSSLLGFGATAPEALRHVSDALVSHAQRFDDVVRDTKVTQARTQMGRFALTPSRIYPDSTVWNMVNDRDSSRSVTIAGYYDQVRSGYTFSASPNVRAPQALGSSRHLMRLELEPDGAYAWDTSVDQAIGTMAAAFAGRALTMLFASAESPTARDLRGESAQAFPRTGRALGRLFSIDSARATPLADGSSSTSLAVQWHSDRIRGTMPYFASYVAKYIEPSTYRITLHDRRGQTYFQVHGDKGRLLVRWRSRAGRLLPLEGGGTAMPDTLRLRLDFNTKYKMFRVGFSDMTADFIVQRGPHLAAWMMRFRQEPNWKLPLFTETLMRSPLRRPFQGRGSELYLGVRDDAGPQTLLVRQTHTEVKESAVLRWIGSLGATAMSDFQGRAEAEENRFLSEAFAALRADAQEVLGPGATREP